MNLTLQTAGDESWLHCEGSGTTCRLIIGANGDVMMIICPGTHM